MFFVCFNWIKITNLMKINYKCWHSLTNCLLFKFVCVHIYCQYFAPFSYILSWEHSSALSSLYTLKHHTPRTTVVLFSTGIFFKWTFLIALLSSIVQWRLCSSISKMWVFQEEFEPITHLYIQKYQCQLKSFFVIYCVAWRCIQIIYRPSE